MIHQIIAQVEQSDRNIYLTIEDGALVSVNFSQGLGEIDSHFLTTHNSKITQCVMNALANQGDELYSAEFFFPSPYWDEQVDVIDKAIGQFVREMFLAEEKIERMSSEIQLKLVEQSKLHNEIENLRAQIKIIGGTYGI